MTPEAWTVIAVGIAIAGLFIRMDARMGAALFRRELSH